MKSPLVIHYRCLDTFGLRGVAQSYGAGAAGVRLTTEGLAAYVRQSSRATPPVAPPEVAPAPLESDEERVELFARGEVPVRLTPARPARPSMPSLVTIEMGFRKPTTWAAVLLTIGVTFGVVAARIATRTHAPVAHVEARSALATAPLPTQRVAWPHAARAPGPQDTTTLPTTVISADPSSLASPQAHASSAQTRALRSSRSHHGAALLAPPPDSASADDGADDATGVASSERVHQELTDSLSLAQPAER